MITFLLGPSGVGKTSVTTPLSYGANPTEIINLDKVIEASNPRAWQECGTNSTGDLLFWQSSSALIEEVERQSHQGNVIIDVGAGTLRTDFAYYFFKERHHRLIVLYDLPENVLVKLKNRSYTPHKNVEGLRLEEYSERRMRFYELGTMCDVTGLSLLDACKKFSEIYHSIISPNLKN